MGKILTSEQVRGADSYTIKNEPISSIDLMERAGLKCFNQLGKLFPSEKTYDIYCGIGNNGGDGLVIARLLAESGKNVRVNIVMFSDKTSPDFDTNLARLKNTSVEINTILPNETIAIKPKGIIIDALLGTGVTRKLSGLLQEVSAIINDSGMTVVSIDFPSGLFDKGNTDENRDVSIQANHTFTFQVPKLAFLFQENSAIVGDWTVIDIGLDQNYINSQPSPFHLIEEKEIKKLIHTRKPFSHKGTFGHALIASGSYGKMGATVLCASACLRTGVGLLTLFVPSCGYEILQTTVPEAMTITGTEEKYLAGKIEPDKFNAIGVGPGIDTQQETSQLLSSLFASSSLPMVIDADAINILAKKPNLWESVPPYSILTPHPKEFERLFGSSTNSMEQIGIAQDNASNKNIILVLKGRYTAVVLPNKSVYYNTTGNPGMATGGSGDVLTGILTSLIAQGYLPEEASKVGVYLHGLAGNLASIEKGEEAMIASDIVANIGEAYKVLHHQE